MSTTRHHWEPHTELNAGPIFKITALGTEIVFIGSASLLAEICDERRFRKCVTGPVVEIRHAVHDGLFTAYDNEKIWGVAHRIMAPLLGKESVEESFVSMRDTAAQLVSKWAPSAEGEKVDVLGDLKRITLQAVMRCFFDQKRDCLGGAEPPMIKAMDSATLEAVKRPTRPKIMNWLLYQRGFDRDTKTMRDFGTEVLKTRRAKGDDRKDMLHALMHAKDPETGQQLDEQRIVDEIVTLCIGTATAPNLVAFALYYLLRNPEELAKACAEIDAILSPGESLTLANFSKLQYCEAVLRESIRLSATAPGFNIEPIPSSNTAETVTLAGGQYQITKNQIMIAVLGAVNRDPEVFDEPEAFRPARMLGEAFERLPIGVKKWFGNGKRECIGKLFGWQWSLVTLVSILRGVRLEMADSKYELRMDGAFSVAPVGFFALAGPKEDAAQS